MAGYSSEPEHFIETQSDIYLPERASFHFTGTKCISSYEQCRPLNDWLRDSWRNVTGIIGYLVCNGNDFQHQNEVAILSEKGNGTSTFFKPITRANVLKSCIYFSVRHAIEADWLNDRDQFLCPNGGWADDFGFQADCLAFALFHGQNRITSSAAVNHWIPFSEKDVDAKGLAKSHFMADFLVGKATLGVDGMTMIQVQSQQ